MFEMVIKELSAQQLYECNKLEEEIRNHLGIEDKNRIIFNYKPLGIEGEIKLLIETINPRHNTKFLFHAEAGIDKLDVLKKSVHYTKAFKKKEYSYTVRWNDRLDPKSEMQTSYFYASNIYKILDKLFYNRDENSLTIYSIDLNPES